MCLRACVCVCVCVLVGCMLCSMFVLDSVSVSDVCTFQSRVMKKSE